MWPGAEPSQGAYSADYVRKLKRITQAAAQRGIYTLLDMHQDDLSENFCGEGKSFYSCFFSLLFCVEQNDGTGTPPHPNYQFYPSVFLVLFLFYLCFLYLTTR